MNLFMNIFINILIVLFIVLFIFKICINKEGLTGNETDPVKTYQPYDPTNPLILAQQNAGNIQILKGQMDELIGMKKELSDVSGNLILLSDQVNQIMLQQSNYATQKAPSLPIVDVNENEEAS